MTYCPQCGEPACYCPEAAMRPSITFNGLRPAQWDTRRMAETGTGSVRSTGSAVGEADAPELSPHNTPTPREA